MGVTTVGNVMLFAGFQGSVKISPEDHCLYGTVLNIKHLVTYEAYTPLGLEVAFKNAVLDYINSARESDIKELMDKAVIQMTDLARLLNVMEQQMGISRP